MERQWTPSEPITAVTTSKTEIKWDCPDKTYSCGISQNGNPGLGLSNSWVRFLVSAEAVLPPPNDQYLIFLTIDVMSIN